MLLIRGGSHLYSLRTSWTKQILHHAKLSSTKSKGTINSSDLQEVIVHSPYESINIPRTLLHHVIWKNVDRWSNKTAIVCAVHGKKFSYGELRKNCKKFAAALLKCGFKSGQDVVTLVLPNMPEYPIASLGAIEAGLTVSPLNPVYSAEEIANQISDSGSKCIITHYEQLHTVLEATSQESLKGRIRIICVDDYDGTQRTLPSGVIRFSEMLTNTTSLHDDSDVITPENIVLLPYSSGTTGLPKGVCLSHNNVTSNLFQITSSQMDGNTETTANHQDTVPAILPFFHIYGYVLTMLRGLFNGAKLVTLPKFDPHIFLEVLKSNKEIILNAVPPIILFLGSHPSVKPEHLDQIRLTMSGGAPCSSEDLQRLLAKRKHRIFQAYGLTEASPVLTYPMKTDENLSSIGPLVPNTQAKVIDWGSGDTLPIGSVGELCFKGPQVMVGYHNRPESTAETVDKDGWLHTGDIGYFDNFGNCFIMDRIKELIKVKGFQVAPAELEAVLRQHPDISDAAVTSVPCMKSGELPVAFVVAKSQKQEPNERQIRAFVSSKVAPYKQLSQVLFIDSIPKTPSGKILRRKLKELVKTELNIMTN